MSEQGDATARTEILVAGDNISPPAHGRRLAVIFVAVVAVVAAGGVGFAVGTMVGGGGSQPEDVLPSTVVAYADVDLNPGASQKLNAVRLLGRFPGVQDAYGAEPDIRQVLVQQLTDRTPLDGVDVSDWAGDRLGVALAWDDDAQALTPVLAIQVTDEKAAVDDLTAVLDGDQVASSDGYVVITAGANADVFDSSTVDDTDLQTQTAAEIVAAADRSSLSDSPTFTGAFTHLDDGVASLYSDGPGIAAALRGLVSGLGGPMGIDSQLSDLEEAGVTAAVVRAEPDAIELDAWSSSTAASDAATPVSLVSGLPESTLFALEFTGGSSGVSEQWERFQKAMQGGVASRQLDRALAQLEAQYDIRIPEDLQTLLGDDVLVAVDGEGLLNGIPGAGVRSLTDPAAGADLANRLQHSLALLSGGFGLTAHGTKDGMIVATTDDYARDLETGDGGLGESPSFQRAVPDAATARFVMWLDIAAVSGTLALTAPDAADLIAPLDSFGVSVTPDGDGTQVRARLVFTDDDS
jgi:hypothetical protein